MTRFVTRLLCTLTLFAFAPAHAGDIVRDYPAEKVAEHTWVITGPMGEPSPENEGFMNNPGFVIGEKGIVVIDPGSSVQAGRMVMKQIAKVSSLPVTDVLITHVHGDHWLGNQAIVEAFPDARFYAHPEMIRKAKESEAELWVDMMSRLTSGFTDGTNAYVPEIEINDGDVLKLNGLTFRIHGPENAHSKTDVMIEVVEDGVMFLGDNVTYGRLARMDDGTFLGNIDACQVAIDSGAKIFVPGHGPTAGVEVPTSFMTYLETVYQSVEVLLDEDLQAFEMKPLILEKVRDYESWVDFDINFGKHISLAVLEVERNF